MHNLALMHANGWGVPKNDATAVDFLKRAADLGEPSAQTALGIRYLEGRGVAHDSDKGVALLRNASARHPHAQVVLGHAYMTGRGIPRDYAQAIPLLKASAASGDDDAMLYLAELYLKSAAAVELLTRSADKNNSYAQALLGHLYLTGLGVQRSYARADELFRKAAEQGHARAQAMVGMQYERGGTSRGEPDYAQALVWYQKAADQGDVVGCQGLLQLYGRERAPLPSPASLEEIRACAKKEAPAMDVGDTSEGSGVRSDIYRLIQGLGRFAIR